MNRETDYTLPESLRVVAVVVTCAVNSSMATATQLEQASTPQQASAPQQVEAERGGEALQQKASLSYETKEPDAIVLSEDVWRLRIEPGVWYLGIGGRLRMPSPGELGNGEKIEVDELGFDSPNIVPIGEAHLFFGEVYRVSIRGYVLGDDQQTIVGRSGQIGGVAFNSTSELVSSFDFGSLEIEAGARVYHVKSDHRSQSGVLPMESEIALFVGAQVIDIDWNIRRTPAPDLIFLGDESTEYSNTFLLPRVGGKWSLRLYEEFVIDLTLALATLPHGDATATTGDVIAGFAWEPHPNFGVQIGYRAAEFDLRDGDSPSKFEYGGGNQGLQFSIILKF